MARGRDGIWHVGLTECGIADVGVDLLCGSAGACPPPDDRCSFRGGAGACPPLGDRCSFCGSAGACPPPGDRCSFCGSAGACPPLEDRCSFCGSAGACPPPDDRCSFCGSAGACPPPGGWGGHFKRRFASGYGIRQLRRHDKRQFRNLTPAAPTHENQNSVANQELQDGEQCQLTRVS